MKQKAAMLLLIYFRFLARLQLKKFAPDVIGITGSAGKTTTRNAVTAVLREKYQVRVSEKANSESGIPLHILGLTPHNYSVFDWLRLAVMGPIQLLTYWQPHEKYIVEMGIDSPMPPKNMEYLLSIVKPRIGIFLNALPVHSFAFDNLVDEIDSKKRQVEIKKQIAKEKGKLITTLPANGLAILNADDANVIAFAGKTDAQVMTFGKSEQADVCIKQVSYKDRQTSFDLKTAVGSIKLRFPYLLPEHYAYSMAAAVCVALDEGMNNVEIADVLHRNFRLEPGRMSLFPGVQGSTIIDSSYNASAQPTIEALEMLPLLKARRKVAVLGDMRELGKETRVEHERVMDAAMKHCHRLVLVGPLMKEHALPYLTRKKFPDVQWFATAPQAGDFLKTSLQEDDLVLVKGSQNTIFLETAIEKILAMEDDRERLCRRGTYWNSIRKNQKVSV